MGRKVIFVKRYLWHCQWTTDYTKITTLKKHIKSVSIYQKTYHSYIVILYVFVFFFLQSDLYNVYLKYMSTAVTFAL